MCYIAVLFGFHSSSFIIKKMLLTIIGLGLIGGQKGIFVGQKSKSNGQIIALRQCITEKPAPTMR